MGGTHRDTWGFSTEEIEERPREAGGHLQAEERGLVKPHLLADTLVLAF